MASGNEEVGAATNFDIDVQAHVALQDMHYTEQLSTASGSPFGQISPGAEGEGINDLHEA